MAKQLKLLGFRDLWHLIHGAGGVKNNVRFFAALGSKIFLVTVGITNIYHHKVPYNIQLYQIRILYNWEQEGMARIYSI